MAEPIFQIETIAGTPIKAGEAELIPFSRAVILRFPGWRQGGVIWNRPVSVLVTGSGGQEEILRVRDVTRMGQIAILAAGFIGSLLIYLALRKSCCE